MPSPSALIGRKLEDRYTIEKRLGAGGMGEVYLARDERLDGNRVAIKFPLPGMLEDEATRERWNEEIRGLIVLEPHPHVVLVLDRGTCDGVPFFVMQFQPGGSLMDRLKSAGGRLSPEDVRAWLPDAASALDHLHARETIHRDVKPGNFLFDASGNVFVTDFGIARALERASMTRTGVAPGTPAYMAPEAAKLAWTPAYDQYALATTVYECLSGRLPFPEADGYALLTMKATQDPMPLALAVPDLPDGLSECVMKALERDPGRRYSSCGEFAEAYENCFEKRIGRSWVAVAATAIAGAIGLVFAYTQFIGPTRVTVTSDPPARISFDGANGMTAFVSGKKPRGVSFRVALSRPGFRPFETTVAASRWTWGGPRFDFKLEPVCADPADPASTKDLTVRFDGVDIATVESVMKRDGSIQAVGTNCAADARVVSSGGIQVQEGAGKPFAPPIDPGTDTVDQIAGNLEALKLVKILRRGQPDDDSLQMRVSDRPLAGALPPETSGQLPINTVVHIHVRSSVRPNVLLITVDPAGSVSLLLPHDPGQPEALPQSWFEATHGMDVEFDAAGQTTVLAWASSKSWKEFLDLPEVRATPLAAGTSWEWSSETRPTALEFANAFAGNLDAMRPCSADVKTVTIR